MFVRTGWVKDRAELVGIADVGGVLTGCPRADNRCLRERGSPRLEVSRIYDCRLHTAGRPAGQAAGCIHPFVYPRHGWSGAWGGFASGSGGANQKGRPLR
jgi:hypothetical protein